MYHLPAADRTPSYSEMSAVVCNLDLSPCPLHTVSFDANRVSKSQQVGLYPFGSFPLLQDSTASSSSSTEHVTTTDSVSPVVGTHITYSDASKGIEVSSQLFSERPLVSADHIPSVVYRLPQSWRISHRLLKQLDGKTSTTASSNSKKVLITQPSSYQEYVELHGSTFSIAYRLNHPYFQGRIQTMLRDKLSTCGDVAMRVTPHLVLGTTWVYEPLRSGIHQCRVGAHYPLKKLLPFFPYLQQRGGSALAEVDFQKGCSVHFRVPLRLSLPYVKKDTAEGLLVVGTQRFLFGLQTPVTRFVDRIVCYADIARQSSLSIVLSKEVSKEVNVQLFSQWGGGDVRRSTSESASPSLCRLLRPGVGIRFTSAIMPSTA